MGSFKRKSQFQKPENLNKFVVKGERFNICELSLLKEFRRNNYAHIIFDGRGWQLTDRRKASVWGLRLSGMPREQKQWLVSPCKIWFHRLSSSSLRINGRNNELYHAAIFEVHFGKKSEGAITDSRERTAETLFSDVWSVALAVEGSDLSITEDEAIGGQIRSSKTSVLRVPSPPRAGNEGTLSCSTVFRKKYCKNYNITKSMSLLEMPMRQQTNTTKSRSTKICTILQLPLCWGWCNVRSMWDAHLKADFILIITTNFSQLRPASDLIVASRLFSYGENHLDPELWENSWSTRVSVRRVKRRKEQAEDSSYPKGIEVMLRETARKSYPDPEDIDNPMISPQDYDIRQSERVLELQNRDLWIRPTDLSWHFPILMTIVRYPSEISVEDHSRSWKAETRPREGPFHVLFNRTPMIFESQDATKKTSALKESSIFLFMKMMTLDSSSVAPRVVTMPTSRPTGICRLNNLYQDPVLEDYFCKEEEHSDSELEE